jgi:hypothetical protein
MTECNQESFEFEELFSRQVVARFDGGTISSDAGGLLLRETDRRIRLLKRLRDCFRDGQNPARVEHRLEPMLAQRIYALALGYEDLNDHDQLREDPLLAVLAGKSDPTGQDRKRQRDKGKPLAGKSTLNRLEHGIATPDHYKKVNYDAEAIDRLLVDLWLEAHTQAPEEVILDLDTTDVALHGHQEGRFFHGYYNHYCCLPLYTLYCKSFPRGSRDEFAAAAIATWPTSQRIDRYRATPVFRRLSGRHLARPSGQLEAGTTGPHCMPSDAAMVFLYSRALAMASSSFTVRSLRLLITIRPPISTVSTSLPLSAYATWA